jgi:hypothetical protein
MPRGIMRFSISWPNQSPFGVYSYNYKQLRELFTGIADNAESVTLQAESVTLQAESVTF